jgi:sulfatase modifying factor 1
MNKRLFFAILCGALLASVPALIAGTSFGISPSTVYDLSPSYMAVGLSVIPVGITNAVYIVSDNSGDGGTALKLGGDGLLNDGQMVGIEFTVSGLGILSFDWKVSSEQFWDWLSFYEVGTSQTNKISGITGWDRQSAEFLGDAEQTHIFRWEYEKDPYGDYVGDDCGWVDAIKWTPFYTASVSNGAGDGIYTNLASVTITADAPPQRYLFDRWTGDTNSVADVFASTTALTMPATNVVLTAIYKPILYPLNVSNGNGGGTYPYGSTVEIIAEAASGKRFYCWTGDISIVANVNAATTTVTTSDIALTVTATYSLSLTVDQGTGSGWYTEGAIAYIAADPDPMWKEFSAWIGDVGLISNLNAKTTTLTMPTGPASVTASYKDSISRLTGSYGRTYSESGSTGAITSDAGAESPSGTPAVKLGGSGFIPDNGFAAFETVVSGSGSISFWWRVSSQLNADYLKFKIDGIESNTISGTKGPWVQVACRIEGAGDHTLRWEYVKDGSVASSTDAGWVDDIVWVGDVQNPLIVPVIVNAILTNQCMAIQFTGERGITYLIQTNGVLSHSGWGDYQILQPTWINESNGVHRFELTPPASAPDKLFYRLSTPVAVPPVTEGMILVPGGTNSGTDPDFGAYSLTVESFYMDRFEVTKALWDEVRTWASANGYTDLPTGGGKAANHPVLTVSWCDVVKWCNARSQKAGLTPVYYTDDAMTLVYKTGDVSEPYVKASAVGYRLPTDVQWEYAARGGVANHRLPWSDVDTIQHARANYYSSSSYAYDTSPTRGFHRTYDTGVAPYTSPGGSFAPNGYGLYDMAGNVWEWCYDWHPSYVGSYRVLRGGSWASHASYCQVAYRFSDPNPRSNYFGFRAVLPPGQQ